MPLRPRRFSHRTRHPKALKGAAGIAVGVAFAGAVAYGVTHGGRGADTPKFNAGTIGAPVTVTPTAFAERLQPTVPPPATPAPVLAPTPASFACPAGWAVQ